MELRLAGDEASDFLNFVVKDEDSATWFDLNGTNFQIPLRGPEPGPALGALSNGSSKAGGGQPAVRRRRRRPQQAAAVAAPCCRRMHGGRRAGMPLPVPPWRRTAPAKRRVQPHAACAAHPFVAGGSAAATSLVFRLLPICDC